MPTAQFALPATVTKIIIETKAKNNVLGQNKSQ